MTKLAWAVAIGITLGATGAEARVIQMPEGGRAVVVLESSATICGPLPAGWTLEGDGRMVKPPSVAAAATAIIDLKVAPTLAACPQANEIVTLVATGPIPEIDAAGTTFQPDEGRIEIRGQRLAGVQVAWRAGDRSGVESCVEPSVVGKTQQCVVPVPMKLPVDVALRWLPARARLGVGSDVTTYDGNGRKLDDGQLLLRPARAVISSMFAAGAAVDVSGGQARLPLLHPEAVSSVDCGQATCELSEGVLLVWAVPATAPSVTIRLRMAPRVSFQRGATAESALTETVPVFRCQVSVVSGPPLRDADDSQLVVRMDQQDPRCGKDIRLRWVQGGGETLEIVQSRRIAGALFVQLRAGRISADRVTVTALRADVEGAVVASASVKTIPAPRPRTIIELPRWGRIEFIPTNREATLLVAGAGDRARFVPLPMEGAYTVRSGSGRQFLLRGDENAGGFVSLRFAYRVDGLPTELGDVDLATVSEKVQRAVREASVPTPLAASAEGPSALVEFLCADAGGNTWRLAPARPYRIPFDSRDTCRVVIHLERFRPEDGLQEIILDVDVTRADGTSRSESRLSERMVLSPGADSRIIPLRGGSEQFDHVVVRVSHVMDETRYALNPLARNGVPAVQWSATIEGGKFRLYATAAIPAGLYRVNQPSGQLTLNFGVLSRITTLDHHGKERLLGVETGLMGVGLIQSPGAIGPYPPTLAAVGGLGIRVPLGGGAAAVGVHAWVAYEFRKSFQYVPDPADPMTKKDAPRWMFIFGPSIAIGNIGTNL